MTTSVNTRFARCVAAAAILLLSGCREEILHDLNEIQANRVLVVLTEAGITAAKVREGGTWAVSVATDKAADALRALESRRINRKELRRFNEQSKGILQSREERSQFLERRNAWNLEQTLESLPEVLEAHVHLFAPPADEFVPSGAKSQMSASVLLIAASKGAVNAAELKSLVASAVGIPAQNVVVIVSEERIEPPKVTAKTASESSGRGSRGIAAAIALGATLGLLALLHITRRRKRGLEVGSKTPEAGRAPDVQLFAAAQEVF